MGLRHRKLVLRRGQDGMSKCCTDCFEDEYVINYITEKGSISRCDYCFQTDVRCIDVTRLTDLFEPLLQLYEVATYGRHYDTETTYYKIANSLFNLIPEDWGIFREYGDWTRVEDLLFDILNGFRACEDQINGFELYSRVFSASDYVDSGRLWEQFCEEIKHKTRFFVTKEINSDELAAALQRNVKTIKPGKPMYRARLGGRNQEGRTFPYEVSEIGAPPADKVGNGRANPAGITYLYLASNPETAMSEVRPFKGATITVGQFHCTKEIGIVDLSIRKPRRRSPFGEYELLRRIEHQQLLKRLSSELARPVDPNMSLVDYLPTQYLTEFIKTHGYDGLAFKSSLGNGTNYVIFNQENFICETTSLRRVKGLSYTFDNTDP